MKVMKRIGGGGVVLAAAIMLTAVVVAVVGSHGGVPLTDKDLESEESMWNLYERWRSVYAPGSQLLAEEMMKKMSRFEVFKANARYIHEFNKRKDASYKFGLNKFSDLTQEEFTRMYTGAKVEDDIVKHYYRNAF